MARGLFEQSKQPKFKPNKKHPQGTVRDDSPKARRRRAMRQYLDTTQWTDPLTRRQVLQEAEASAHREFAPVRRGLRDDLRTSGRQQKNIDLGYDIYRKRLAQLQQGTQQLYGAATQQVFNAAHNARQQDAAQAQQLGAQAQQDAAQRGAVAAQDPSATQAARARQMLENSWGALLASQGAGAANRLVGEQGIVEGRRVQAHAEEAGRARQTREKMRELKSDRGAFLNDFISKAREGERRYTLERKAFGLDKQKAKDDAKADRAALKAAKAKEATRQMEADRKYQLDLAKYGADQAKDNYLKTHGLGTYKPPSSNSSDNRPERSYGPGGRFTRAELRSNREDFDTAVAKVRSDPKWSPSKADQFINALVAGGTPRPIAVAAVHKVAYGGTDRKNAHKVRHRYGLKVKVKRHHKNTGGVQGFFDHLF